MVEVVKYWLIQESAAERGKTRLGKNIGETSQDLIFNEAYFIFSLLSLPEFGSVHPETQRLESVVIILNSEVRKMDEIW